MRKFQVHITRNHTVLLLAPDRSILVSAVSTRRMKHNFNLLADALNHYAACEPEEFKRKSKIVEPPPDSQFENIGVPRGRGGR